MANKIFYYRHTNNEVYQLRFKKVIINLEGLYNHIVKGRYHVSYIEVEVASLGTLFWSATRHDNTLHPQCIFETVGLTINGENASSLNVYKITTLGLKQQDVFKVTWGGFPWDCNIFDIDDIEVPEHIMKVHSRNLFGQDTINYKTWIWNGLEPKEKGYLGQTKLHNELGQLILGNSYGSLLYDLITHECIYDNTIKGYTTKEECIANNAVKVHCF